MCVCNGTKVSHLYQIKRIWEIAPNSPKNKTQPYIQKHEKELCGFLAAAAVAVALVVECKFHAYIWIKWRIKLVAEVTFIKGFYT